MLKKKNSIFFEERLSEIKNSLWLSFHYANKLNESMILESYGMVPNVDLYIGLFKEFLLQQINNEVNNKTFVLTNNIFSSIPGCWFNDVEIKVQYTNDQTKPKYVNGNFKSKVTLIQNKINILRGTFVLNGDIDYVIKKTPLIIGHELLHAYESWKRLISGNKSLFDTAKDGRLLQNNQITNASKNKIERALASIFYYCNNIERRAYLAQLNHELLSYQETIEDVDSALQIIQNSSAYQNLIIAGENLQAIKRIIKTKPEYRTIVVNYYQQLTSEKRSAEYVLKYLEKIWFKTWKHFRLRTTRLVKSLFDSNNVAPAWIEEFDKPLERLKLE